MNTREKGHIPRNYVAFQSSIESEEWFFGQISRREAEDLLMVHTNTRGTFLIRESEQNPGGFALSIKDYDQERLYHVKHYKIKPLDNNRGYFITTRQTFPTLGDLVTGYQSAACKGIKETTRLKKIGAVDAKYSLQVKINYLEKMSSGQTDASMKTGV